MPGFSPREFKALYLIVLSVVLGVVIGVGSWLLGAGWLGGIVFGILAFFATMILVARRIAPKLQPVFEQVQRQAQARLFQPAIATLESALPLANWIPLAKGQIYANIGILHHYSNNRAAATSALQNAGRRSGDARLMLGSFLYQDGKKAEAFKVFGESILFNRKHALLHNTYAWLLNKEGKRDEAIAVLTKLLLKDSNEETADNRLRLQNEQRMNMSVFGPQWYLLGFETPPASMGQMQTAPKGFRQPPKGFRQPPKEHKKKK